MYLELIRVLSDAIPGFTFQIKMKDSTVYEVTKIFEMHSLQMVVGLKGGEIIGLRSSAIGEERIPDKRMQALYFEIMEDINEYTSSSPKYQHRPASFLSANELYDVFHNVYMQSQKGKELIRSLVK